MSLLSLKSNGNAARAAASTDGAPILEIRHLRIVSAVARFGSVSRGAEIVHLTQPGVSHALRDVERRLGVELFRRTPRRMEVTAEGERVVRAAEVILEELRRTEYDIARLRGGQLGTISLTTECYTCYHWLPELVSDFGKDFPGIDIRIVPEATEAPYRALLDGRVDVAVVHSPDHPDGVVLERLFRDELVAVVPANHRLARRKFLTAEDFAQETVVLHSNPASSALFAHVLAPAGVSPAQVLQLRLTEAVLQFVRAGLGITVMARWAIGSDLPSGSVRAVRLSRNGIRRTWYLAALARDRRPRHLQAFMDQLRSTTAPAIRARTARGSAERVGGPAPA